jgi:probable phosphoglycerate mutase
VNTPVSNPLARATLYECADLELVLVRHGQQIPLQDRAEDEQTDPPLSGIGLRQIEAVGDHLAGESIDAIYSSHLVRAHDTGKAIAKHHNLGVTVLKDLREIELVPELPKGETWAELNKRPDWVTAGEEFVRTGRWSSFPFSETSDSFRTRISAAFDQILENHTSGKVVIACHGGVINTFVAQLLGIERDFWFRTAHCAVNRVLVGEGRLAVWNLNETHHMSGDLATA